MKKLPNTPQASGGIAEDLKKNLGIDLSEVAKDITKDYVKEQFFGKRNQPVVRSKFSKALDAVASFSRNMWWIPGAAYLALGIAIILIKFMAKMVGV